jgi:hypothetical protein
MAHASTILSLATLSKLLLQQVDDPLKNVRSLWHHSRGQGLTLALSNVVAQVKSNALALNLRRG